MADDLARLAALFQDEEVGRIGAITGVAADRGTRRLELVVDAAGYNAANEHHVVTCDAAMRWALTDDRFDSVRVASEHPALRDFHDERCELYFTGAPADPGRTADALRAAHGRILGRFLELSFVVNGLAGSLEDLLAGGYGKLATGPRPLLDVFAYTLAAEGVRTSRLPASHPDGPAPPFLVLELGRSWVVAKSFTARNG